MKISEDIRKEIWQMCERPESVYFIEKHDGEGFKIEEIDGDYCYACAEKKAKQLDSESGGKYYHPIYEESLPEREHFCCCTECGCPLDASLVVNEFVEDDIQDVVDKLRSIKTFADIKGYLAWCIGQLFGCNEKESYQLFPKQMNYIGRRLTSLYKKQKEG